MKKYLSLEEVAEMLGVNYQLIYKLVRARELPAIRLGRVYRVEQGDLEAYLRQQKTAHIQTGGICSVCGKAYESALSLREACEECGAPICTDCAVRLGCTRCREHSEHE